MLNPIGFDRTPQIYKSYSPLQAILKVEGVNKIKNSRCLDLGGNFGMNRFKMERVEWNDKLPSGKFDLIFCHYVLENYNSNTQKQILKIISQKLEKGGTAYITVATNSRTKYVVDLPLEIFLHKVNNFKTYVIRD